MNEILSNDNTTTIDFQSFCPLVLKFYFIPTIIADIIKTKEKTLLMSN